MRILFVFTGGTIGSTRSNDTIATDSKKPYMLLEKYGEKYSTDFSYDTIEPFTELSENFSGRHISSLLELISERINGNYDGIIVTHGTDTLAYSASACGYAFGNQCIPICLVSSNYPIEDKRQNGTSNLHAAIEIIRSGDIRGTIVPYKNNSDTTVMFHRGTRISNSVALNDDVFSVFNTVMGHIDDGGAFHRNPNYVERNDELSAPESFDLSEQSYGILRVFPYPGMIYPKIDTHVKTVLLDTYHSGTIDGKSEAVKRFLTNANDCGAKIFVTGNAAYTSADIFDKYGVIRLSMSPVAAYMKLWLYENVPLCHGEAYATLSRGGDVFER